MNPTPVIKSALKLNLKLDGSDRPVDSANVSLKADLIYLAKDAFYVRLHYLDFSAQGIQQKDMESYNNARTEMMKGIEKVRGRWIRIPITPGQTKDS